MTKFTLIFPICITLFFGCAVFDNSEMTTEPPTVAVPVVEYEAPKVAPEAVVVAAPSASVVSPPHDMSMEEVRRLQIRLRALRFDSGPVDGIAGMKTKAAFERLQAGCAKLEPLSEMLPMGAAQSSQSKMSFDKNPNRDETLRLQRKLRNAGFDPGPIDGIFGSRMKSLVSHLQPGCIMAKEYDGRLDAASLAANSEAIATVEARQISGGAQPSRQARRVASGDETLARHRPPQEEIRILQLRLRDAGFDPGPFDGVMGPKTKLALEQYEASQRGTAKPSLTTHISGKY